MASKDYTFASLVDVDKVVSEKYEIAVIPQTIVIDKSGIVVAHYFGDKSEEELWERPGQGRRSAPAETIGAGFGFASRSNRGCTRRHGAGALFRSAANYPG